MAGETVDDMVCKDKVGQLWGLRWQGWVSVGGSWTLGRALPGATHHQPNMPHHTMPDPDMPSMPDHAMPDPHMPNRTMTQPNMPNHAMPDPDVPSMPTSWPMPIMPICTMTEPSMPFKTCQDMSSNRLMVNMPNNRSCRTGHTRVGMSCRSNWCLYVFMLSPVSVPPDEALDRIVKLFSYQ